MGMSSLTARLWRSRWRSTILLVLAGLICPMLAWMVLVATRTERKPNGADLEEDRRVARHNGVPRTPELAASGARRANRSIQSTQQTPRPRSRVSAALSRPMSGEPNWASVSALVEPGEMPPPSRIEQEMERALAPEPEPLSLPPSVELAELIAAGVVEPGFVEYDLDPGHPIAGQLDDSPNEEAHLVQMPPPTRAEPPLAPDPPGLPPSVELVELIASGAVEPADREQSIAPGIGGDLAQMPPPTRVEPPPPPPPAVIPPSARLVELIDQGVVAPGEDAYEEPSGVPATSGR